MASTLNYQAHGEQTSSRNCNVITLPPRAQQHPAEYSVLLLAASSALLPTVCSALLLGTGVLKIGWSWEAKYVWFWRTQHQLATFLAAMLDLPGCTSEYAIVQVLRPLSLCCLPAVTKCLV